MSGTFEDELGEYLAASNNKQTDTSIGGPEEPFNIAQSSGTKENPELGVSLVNKPPAYPLGFVVSADPKYAYNSETGVWLDLSTGIASYYSEETSTYIPIQLIDQQHWHEEDHIGFAGVLRLVVLDSTYLQIGQIIDIDPTEGLIFGRDKIGSEPHIRMPDMAVSRFHARIYISDKVTGDINGVESECALSEDGEIEDNASSYDNDDDDNEKGDGKTTGNCADEDDGEVSSIPDIPHIYIIDHGSTHGTYINGTRISDTKCANKPFTLKHHDQISIGNTTFELHIHEQWACRGCKNDDGNEIQAVPTLEVRRDKANLESTHSQTSGDSRGHKDLQKKRIENLNQIKRKYIDTHERPIRKNQYVDRARQRRLLKPEIRLAAGLEYNTAPESSGNESDTGAIEPISKSNKGYVLLEKIGWSPGSVLGLNSDGRVNPIEISGNETRAGLGADISNEHAENKSTKLNRITKNRYAELE